MLHSSIRKCLLEIENINNSIIHYNRQYLSDNILTFTMDR